MKRLTFIFVTMLAILSASAQETVKLTVSGQGTTKEEATANALRSAIEQSFGVFVSANTQILNDEVVKDEIATISSGNIKGYEELGCITLPNGDQSVSLAATVSIGNLISYAKSKGSSTEFAGQVFAMNIKMRKLNAENEKKAIEHMLNQLDILSRDLFRTEIEVIGQPVKIDMESYECQELKMGSSQPYWVNLELKWITTPAAEAFYNLLFNTLQALSLSETEVEQYSESGEDVYFLARKIKEGKFFDYNQGTINYKKEYLTITGDENKYHQSYFLRTNSNVLILKKIHEMMLNAQLGIWNIKINGINTSYSFDYNEITLRSESSEKKHFSNYLTEFTIPRNYYNIPKNPWSIHPYSKRLMLYNKNEFQLAEFNDGELLKLSIYLQDLVANSSKYYATKLIKIALSEEELQNVTGFEMKKREDFGVRKAQHNNEIWYTNGSTIQSINLARSFGEKIISHKYNVENKCWIVKFEDDVTSIWESLFENHKSLTSITIPNSVTFIGQSAFSGCESLTSITIPNSVTDIGHDAFSGCMSLKSITIPNSVTYIGQRAFSGCESLKSITIPNSQTSIPSFAFSGCINLKNIIIPNSVTYIGERAFENCKSLTNITIPNGVKNISPHVFYNCRSLTSITIPNSVKKIDGYAFYGCMSLTSITIPNSVTYIGERAFENCKSLISITVSNSTRISNGVFSGCESLKNVSKY